MPTNFYITSEVFQETNVSLTFEWDSPQDIDTVFTYNITISLRSPLQAISLIADNPPWSFEVNLNTYMNIAVDIRTVNNYCEIASDAFTLQYTCK